MVKLFLKNSNLCDHNSPTSQTDRRTDRQTTCDRNTALCTKVHRAVKTKRIMWKYMQVVTIHNNQTDEKHKGCNLRLNAATEHEETMSLGNEFQMLTIRSEKKSSSRTDVVRCLYNLMQWPRDTCTAT